MCKCGLNPKCECDPLLKQLSEAEKSAAALQEAQEKGLVQGGRK
jgi:hypothetical protein